jgi:cation:H+ antiporter
VTAVLLDVLALLCGAAALAFSSDVFVRASARLASGLGISPLVVGALVIGFGTSLPELFTSGLAASQGSLGVALGSIVGSDTVNTTLILGVAALMVSPGITSRMLAR